MAERTFTVFNPLRSGATVNFAESIDTVTENIREVAPALFFAVPRIWEKFYSGVALRMRDATPIGKLAYRWAIGVGMRMADRRIEGRAPSTGLRLLHRAADYLVLDNLRRSMGLHRVRGAATGAAPIAPDLIKWYMALGIDMREVYGQTENCGLATGMPGDRVKLGTVGVARPGTEIAVSPEGEILLKGPHIFLGYYKKPEKTAETVVDGWLRTGDVGRIDGDGYLTITDRMKDLIITAGGKNITPSEMENQLKFSPYISDAVVIGDKRRFLSALVMIDHETVAQFAQEQNVPFTNFTSLCRAPQVQDLIWGEIEKVNKQFARVETVQEVSADRADPDTGGRGAHAHDEAQAGVREQEVPRADRRNVLGIVEGGLENRRGPRRPPPSLPHSNSRVRRRSRRSNTPDKGAWHEKRDSGGNRSGSGGAGRGGGGADARGEQERDRAGHAHGPVGAGGDLRRVVVQRREDAVRRRQRRRRHQRAGRSSWSSRTRSTRCRARCRRATSSSTATTSSPWSRGSAPR